MKFLKEVVKPHTKVNASKIVDPIVAKLVESISRHKIKATVMVGGSVAKGTSLKVFDCDIFIRFDKKKYEDRSLSELLEKVLDFVPSSKLVRVHGSRDYFKFMSSGVEFEIIPVLYVNNYKQALNVTDMSPLHVEWVKSHVAGLENDIKLAKLFCKAQGVYGAESYITGFSGYMLEVLTIHYGGFLELLKGVSNWKPKKVIDHSQHYKNHKEVLNKLNDSKLDSPLIVIDPVQKNRNAGASIGNEKFAKFIIAAREFLNKPSKKFFVPEKFSLTKVRAMAKKFGGKLILVEVVPVSGKKDVVGSKILKCYRYLYKEFQRNEFNILEAGWHWANITLLWYIVYPDMLPKVKLHTGPLVYSSEKDVMSFIKKRGKYAIDNYKLVSMIKRKYRKPEDLAKFVIKDYFVSKIKRGKLIR